MSYKTGALSSQAEEQIRARDPLQSLVLPRERLQVSLCSAALGTQAADPASPTCQAPCLAEPPSSPLSEHPGRVGCEGRAVNPPPHPGRGGRCLQTLGESREPARGQRAPGTGGGHRPGAGLVLVAGALASTPGLWVYKAGGRQPLGLQAALTNNVLCLEEGSKPPRGVGRAGSQLPSTPWAGPLDISPLTGFQLRPPVRPPPMS